MDDLWANSLVFCFNAGCIICVLAGPREIVSLGLVMAKVRWKSNGTCMGNVRRRLTYGMHLQGMRLLRFKIPVEYARTMPNAEDVRRSCQLFLNFKSFEIE
jgi:hypothetical protein